LVTLESIVLFYVKLIFESRGSLGWKECPLPMKAWQPLTAGLVVLGIPATVAGVWRHLLAQHPVVALMLAVGWLAVCGLGLMVRQALSGPARRRLEQAGNAADRAAGQWLSGYGRRYRKWVLDSRRYVKDLATGDDPADQVECCQRAYAFVVE
jgi:hypothetical protein